MKYITVIIVMMMVGTAQAAEVIYGYAPMVHSFTVKDPDGNSPTKSDATPLGLAAIYDLGRENRLYLEIEKIDYSVKGDVSNIGQKVSGYTIAGSRQSYLKFSRSIKFWGGYGVSYSKMDFKNRYVTDSTGLFLGTQYPDRSSSDFGLLLNAGNEWDFGRGMQWGINVSYRYSLSHGVTGPTASLLFLFD